MPFNSNHWITDPEYIDLLNYIIDQTKDVESPLSVQRLVREFKEKSGAAQTVKCLKTRIYTLRTKIHSFGHIDTNTKVKMMFALSASANAGFLKELEKNAFVVIDEKKRITYYNANDGSLELSGDHSHSAKTRTGVHESKRCLRPLINNYFEKKNNADAVPTNEGEGEMSKLIEFIIGKCDKVNSPLSITRLAEDFVKKFRVSTLSLTVRKRIRGYALEIQRMEFVETRSKVQQLFGLSATVNSDCLEKLRENALVEVDEKNRIVVYKANDGSIELRGDHSRTAKIRSSKLDTKQSLRSLIINYFENKNNADAVPKNEEERETGNLIEFITEKCENANSPLSIGQLTEDFNNRFGTARSFYCIHNRVKGYCREIQTLEFLDTHSKVNQLFGLGATLDSDCLEKLREEAFVEVDHKNRITIYTANDNSLSLRGRHWGSENTNPRRIRKKTVKGVVNMSDNEGLDDDSDEYSSEESGSEFDTDDEAGNIEMSIEDDFEFDPQPPTTPKSSKRKTGTTGTSSSKRVRPSSDDSMRPNEMDDYDTNYSIDDQVKLEPVFGSTQENLNEIEGDEDIQQVLKSTQALDEHDQVEEVSIKIEHEEPVEVKPESSHNSKIKFLEVMQSLIVSLNTPSLFWIHSKIHQKIQKLGESEEVIQNNEIVLIIQLLIARMTNHSVENLSKSVESVNLSYFLCYLKAAIQISKLSGVDDLVKNISELIEESQNKRIPMEKVENALRATLNIDGF